MVKGLFAALAVLLLAGSVQADGRGFAAPRFQQQRFFAPRFVQPRFYAPRVFSAPLYAPQAFDIGYGGYGLGGLSYGLSFQQSFFVPRFAAPRFFSPFGNRRY